MRVPEVEVLGHVDLLEYIHEALLLRWFLDSVVEADWDDVRVFAVVEVVPPEKRDHGALRYEDDVPASGEANEASKQ